ncbi:LamG domain-containing protein [Candidatus Poribacteria bacterium]|nr:LamG domain-containing protein [Candidatus Poribacteria bacterium]
MKTTILCLTILIIGAVFSAHAAKLDLASAWLFEENGGKVVKDVVSGHDGDIKGTLKWVGDGKFGGALEFPGKGDSYVRVDHDDVFNADPYTFVAWVKLNAASWQYVVWRNGDVWPEPTNVRHLDIWIHDADYPVFMWHVKGQVGRIDGKTIVADGQWHHIAKIYDGSKVQMFVDGKLEGEKASGGTLDTSKSPIWIGARPGNVAATGLFDEVGFFTKALTEAQVNDVMDTGLADYAAVEASGKATTTWGLLKSKK